MGCCDSESTNVRDVAVLAVSLGISLALLIVAGVTGGKNWLPMLNLGAVILVPMAVILSEVMAGNLSVSGYDETKVAWANFGSCFMGVILASLIGLPLVLLHVGQLDSMSFGLWIGSTVVTIAASVFYWMSRAAKKAY